MPLGGVSDLHSNLHRNDATGSSGWGMTVDSFRPWQAAFMQVVRDTETAAPLKEAALAERLRDWTTHLTTAVVRSCEALGWRAAGKGNPLALLPQAGQEYLGIDVMAFSGAAGDTPPPGRWPLPVAVFELENVQNQDRIAYSLWKVLCIRAGLRVVFAYRPDVERGRKLVSAVGDDVIGALSAEQLGGLEGQTALVVGNRGEGETFPYGYFKSWLLNRNLGRFEKV